MAEYVVEMRDIVKDFPGLRANDHITLQLKKGEVHALLGENAVSYTHLDVYKRQVLFISTQLKLWKSI